MFSSSSSQVLIEGINKVLLPNGLEVQENGKIRFVVKAETLDEVDRRVSRDIARDGQVIVRTWEGQWRLVLEEGQWKLDEAKIARTNEYIE